MLANRLNKMKESNSLHGMIIWMFFETGTGTLNPLNPCISIHFNMSSNSMRPTIQDGKALGYIYK